MLISGAIITAIVELLKHLGLKKRHILLSVFTLAILFGVIQSFNRNLAETIVMVLGSALAAVGIYETTLKKAKSKV